jgi:hypothetical protein
MKSIRYEHSANYVWRFNVIFSGELREMKSEKIKTHYTLQKFYREPDLPFGIDSLVDTRYTRGSSFTGVNDGTH